MAWGSMANLHQIAVLLSLKGGPEYDAQMKAAAASTGRLGKAVLTTSEEMKTATKRTWLHNQALFTLRRYAFYGTLAVTGLAFEIARLGFQYDSTVQSARVALKTIFPNQQALDGLINRLYRISTLSPFLFKDTLTAFRTMYPAFHAVGLSAKFTTDALQASMNALAVSGKTSFGQLTRVSVQLQHLANIGKPTGQILLALARDGLPVYPALRKELHLTGTSLENLATSGLTAKQVIEALTKYETQVAPFAGAAFRLQTQTLTGNWMMFKDILAQAAGRATGGLFGGLQERLKKINEYLAPLFRANKPIGLYQIAAAINSALTPQTNIIINLFVLFASVLKTVTFEIGLLVKAFDAALTVIKYMNPALFLLNKIMGNSHAITKLFGGILGTLITMFLLAKIALMPFMIAFELWNGVVRVAQGLAIAYRVAQLLLNGEWAAARALVLGNTAATEANTVANEANTMSVTQRTAVMGSFDTVLAETTATTETATVANVGLGASFTAMLGPIGLAIAALTLYISFRKQIANLMGDPSGGNPFSHRFWHSGTNRITPAQWRAAHEHRSRQWYDFMNPMHWFASGGTMGSSGFAMVGERGPELLHLPAQASVIPLNANALAGAGSLAVTVIPQPIYLDGKKIATVMANVVTDKEARMSGRG